MTGEIHEGPLEPTPTPQSQKLTWREKRWERRRKRRMFEEVLGWILVPVILIALYWAVKAGLSALGTSPSAVIQALRTLRQ
jgi:hypothetical protein